MSEVDFGLLDRESIRHYAAFGRNFSEDAGMDEILRELREARAEYARGEARLVDIDELMEEIASENLVDSTLEIDVPLPRLGATDFQP